MPLGQFCLFSFGLDFWAISSHMPAAFVVYPISASDGILLGVEAEGNLDWINFVGLNSKFF